MRLGLVEKWASSSLVALKTEESKTETLTSAVCSCHDRKKKKKRKVREANCPHMAE